MTMKNKQNFLDLIPIKNPDFLWGENQDGLVTVTMLHTGFFDRIAQDIFHKPPYSRLDLDIYGSFIWKQIDGDRSVHAIAMLFRDAFGEEAEPLFPRIVQFFGILKTQRFISWKK